MGGFKSGESGPGAEQGVGVRARNATAESIAASIASTTPAQAAMEWARLAWSTPRIVAFPMQMSISMF
jgi:hypothetical protein